MENPAPIQPQDPVPTPVPSTPVPAPLNPPAATSAPSVPASPPADPTPVTTPPPTASFSPTPAPSDSSQMPESGQNNPVIPDAETVLNGGKQVMKFILNWLIVPGAIVLLLHNFIFQAFHVVGSSMEPNLHDKDYLIISKIGSSMAGVNKLIPGSKDKDYIPSRGAIVVFRFPRDPSLVFVKRVIATPGERVVVKNGKVTVFTKDKPDGFNPDLNYPVNAPVTLGEVDMVVEPGTVFVCGDNRSPNGSYDSREWGALPSEFIIGQAILRLIPVNTFRLLTTENAKNLALELSPLSAVSDLHL